MALERDQLTIDIEVNSSDASKEVDLLSKQMKNLASVIDNLSKNSLSEEIETLNSSLLQLNSTVKSSDLKKLDKDIFKLNKSD